MLALSAMLISASVAIADIRPVLRAQGFYRPLNGRESIRYAGHIHQGRNDYRVYAYRGVFWTGQVDHGVASLIVIRNGSTFFGDYKISMPVHCTVRGQKVICNPESPGRVIEFTKHGPPREIWFDGEVDQIDLGDRLKK